MGRIFAALLSEMRQLKCDGPARLR